MFDEDVLIPFFVFAIPATLVFLIVWLKSREKDRNARYLLQSNLYAKALEKGETLPKLPDDFFAEPAKRNNVLRWAIVLLAVGFGFTLTFWLMSGFVAQSGWHDAEEGVVGLRMFSLLGIIPFLVGLALLLVDVLEKRKKTGEKA